MDTVLHAYRPKMIVWQLTAGESEVKPFSTHECLLTIDSIARLSRPIVVLTGPSILRRTDLFTITEYAFALGLKVIIEVDPRDVTDDIVRTFSTFGKRIFRLMIDRCIVEDIDTRYKHSECFSVLEECVKRLRSAGLEIHLGATIQTPDVRQLAFDHDYAIRRSAAGFYCHFCFQDDSRTASQNGQRAAQIDAMIAAIAEMKSFSPKEMYFSPQCVRYGHREGFGYGKIELADTPTSEWMHWCLGGKTFAFIDVEGGLHLCAGLQVKCGDLRDKEYDFLKIWEESDVMKNVREHEWSCTETREEYLQVVVPHNVENDHENET